MKTPDIICLIIIIGVSFMLGFFIHSKDNWEKSVAIQKLKLKEKELQQEYCFKLCESKLFSFEMLEAGDYKICLDDCLVK